MLVSQPTHPAFYQRDLRQEICNVCKGEFNPPPPSRAELMAGFNGAVGVAFLFNGIRVAAQGGVEFLFVVIPLNWGSEELGGISL